MKIIYFILLLLQSNILFAQSSRIEKYYAWNFSPATFYYNGLNQEQYFKHFLKYPKAAYENRNEGKVILKAHINKNGKVDSVKLIRGIGYGCDEESVRVVKNMPIWKPASYKGIPISSWIEFPIFFYLD